MNTIAANFSSLLFDFLLFLKNVHFQLFVGTVTSTCVSHSVLHHINQWWLWRWVWAQLSEQCTLVIHQIIDFNVFLLCDSLSSYSVVSYNTINFIRELEFEIWPSKISQEDISAASWIFPFNSNRLTFQNEISIQQMQFSWKCSVDWNYFGYVQMLMSVANVAYSVFISLNHFQQKKKTKRKEKETAQWFSMWKGKAAVDCSEFAHWNCKYRIIKCLFWNFKF